MQLIDKLVRDSIGQTYKIAEVRAGEIFGTKYKNGYIVTHSGREIPLVNCTILINKDHSIRGVDLLEEA